MKRATGRAGQIRKRGFWRVVVPLALAACKASSSAQAQKHCHPLWCEAGGVGIASARGAGGTGQLRDASFGQQPAFTEV